MLQGKPRVFTHGDKPFCHMCNNRGDVEGYSDHSNNVAPAEGEINKGLRLGLMMAAKRHDRTWYAYGAEGQRTNHGARRAERPGSGRYIYISLPEQEVQEDRWSPFMSRSLTEPAEI